MFEADRTTMKAHRVIGIRHVLKRFKKEGLVDDETSFADEAVEQIQDELVQKAAKWYQVGARRGAKEVLKALLNGTLTVKRDGDGSLRIVSKKDEISWKKRVTVRAGKRKMHIKRAKYQIDIASLDFE